MWDTHLEVDLGCEAAFPWELSRVRGVGVEIGPQLSEKKALMLGA